MKNSPIVQVINHAAIMPHELTFTTVSIIRQEAMKLIAKQPIEQVDLANVTQSDSAGLALLLDLLRYANQQKKTLRFINSPSHLQAFAKVNGVDALLFN